MTFWIFRELNFIRIKGRAILSGRLQFSADRSFSGITDIIGHQLQYSEIIFTIIRFYLFHLPTDIIGLSIMSPKHRAGKVYMISTKGRYALRVMIDLAEHKKDGNIPLKDIAERQSISKKYLEIIAKELVESGLVSGTSGKGGGYRLSREPKDYSILEILEVMEGTVAPVACLECGAKECPRRSFCKTLPIWQEYYDLSRDFFSSRTLADLADQIIPE